MKFVEDGTRAIFNVGSSQDRDAIVREFCGKL